MRVACLPFDVGVDVAQNLTVVERGLRAARERDVQLVVLPEMWPTSFPATEDTQRLLEGNEEAVRTLARWTREFGLSVAGSALGRTPSLPANRWHLVERGVVVSTYDKVHLFTPTAEDESFSAGAERPHAAALRAERVGGIDGGRQPPRVGGIVCYDLRFPEIARGLFRDGVDVLAVSAQWPAARASHWRALCVGRAVETQAFVVACNRSGRAEIGRRRQLLEFGGDALVVDPHGNVLAEGRGGGLLVIADLDLDLARKLRIHVPVAKDERRDRYAAWSSDPRRTEAPEV